jgi:hypothetical protein
LVEAGPNSPRRAQRRLRRWGSAFAGVLFALVLGELLLRQVYWRETVWEPGRGALPAPGTVQRYCIEGCGSSRWTEGGVRRASLPPPGKPSILVLGDSYTEALMIDDADVFSHRAERLLAERGLDFPVLNVGASGRSVADYVVRAGEYQRRFTVHWTVAQVRGGDFAGDAWIPAKNHFRRADDGALELATAPPVDTFDRLAPLRRSLSLYSFGVYRARQFLAAWAAEPPPFRAPAPPAAPPRPPDYPIEEEFDRLVAAYDRRITLLVLSSAGPETTLEDRIAARCSATRTSCVELRERFGEFARRHESPYGFPNSTWGKGHMNEAGHHVAAELLTDELLRLHALDLL